MQTPKRQIIKTRPQRPYIIARVILALVIVAALVLAVVRLFMHAHAGHAAARNWALGSSRAYSTVQQEEAPLAERKASNQASLGHAYEVAH